MELKHDYDIKYISQQRPPPLLGDMDYRQKVLLPYHIVGNIIFKNIF